MRKNLWWMAAVICLLSATGRAQTAGVSCRYGEWIRMGNGKTTTLYYRLAQAYAAADIVVTGKIVGTAAHGFNLRFRISDVIKGAPEREITLRGQGANVSVKDGFSIPAGKTVMLLLRGPTAEIYDAVENYANDCRKYFEISRGKVLLTPLASDKGGTPVALKTLDSYFASRPPPLTYESK